MDQKSYDNVRNQIGPCGIWCGSCAGGNGATQELTRRYEIFIKNQLEAYAPKDFDFEEFLKGIKSIKSMSLCPGCLKGGGMQGCPVRECAIRKDYESCSSCEELSTCSKFSELEKYLPRIKSDLLSIRGKENRILVDGWEERLKKKWPHCLLFCSSVHETT